MFAHFDAFVEDFIGDLGGAGDGQRGEFQAHDLFIKGFGVVVTMLVIDGVVGAQSFVGGGGVEEFGHGGSEMVGARI